MILLNHPSLAGRGKRKIAGVDGFQRFLLRLCPPGFKIPGLEDDAGSTQFKNQRIVCIEKRYAITGRSFPASLAAFSAEAATLPP